jgi:hypothetical protein
VTPVRRLTFAGAGLIAGGAIIAAGTRLAWATATPKPPTVAVPGLPRVVLAGGKITIDASALDAGFLLGLAFLLALVPLGWLVVGPRGRGVFALAAVVVAVSVFAQVAATRSHMIPRAREIAVRQLPTLSVSMRVASGPGIPVTAAGAGVALVSAVVGGVAGVRTPKLRMPEKPDRREPE